MIKKITYNKTFVSFVALVIISALLIGCSPKEAQVEVNGQSKVVTGKIIKIITKTNQPTVKSAILPWDKGDIEIEYDEVTYKVFESKYSGIVYFNNGEIYQYEITPDELNEIKNAIK